MFQLSKGLEMQQATEEKKYSDELIEEVKAETIAQNKMSVWEGGMILICRRW